VDLPTYTNIWRIEKRLYKLYDFRLPMPLPVGQIAIFTAIAVPYVIILTVLGLPFSHTSFWLYVLPPAVLAWLATRPVLESKRLPELIVSQVRYLGEPRTWCRLAALTEKDEIVVVARVWRRAEVEPLELTAHRGIKPASRRVLAAPRRVVAATARLAAADPDPQTASSVPAAPAWPDSPALRPAASRPAAAASRPPAAAGRAAAAAGGPPAGAIRPAAGTGWPAVGAARPAAAAVRRPAGAHARPGPPVHERAPAARATDRAAAQAPGAAQMPAHVQVSAPAAAAAAGSGRPAQALRRSPLPWPAAPGSPAQSAPGRPSLSRSPAAGPLPAAGAPPVRALPSAAASAPVTFPPPAAGPPPATDPPSAAGRPPAVGPPPATDPPSVPNPPSVTVTGDRQDGRPLRVVERALRGPGDKRGDGWHDRVVVVPGGHRPGRPDFQQRDRARAQLPVTGFRRIVVLGCTVGAGQTMTTLMTGEMLASLRTEPIAVLDLNPGRGSLADRADSMPAVAAAAQAGPDHVHHPAPSRLAVISSDPAVPGAPPDDAARDVAKVFEMLSARYCLTLADPGASAVPRVLAIADQLVLVAPASQDAARAIAMTLEWLEAHGHVELAGNSAMVINGVSRPTMPHVEKAEAVARGRCRAIVRIPWDDQLKKPEVERILGGDPPTPLARPGGRLLGPAAVQAYTALAGVLVAGLSTTPEFRRAPAVSRPTAPVRPARR
jgi:MinD-like ATPase involved in chromosome partitioning or flagellar assembly